MLGQLTVSSKPKKQQKPQYEKQVEALQHLPQDVAKTLKSTATDSAKDMWKQILAPEKLPSAHGGELKPNQALDLKAMEAKKKAEKQQARGAIDYAGEILRTGEHKIARENHEVKQQVEQIVVELSRLAKSSEAISRQVAVTTGNIGTEVGKYHVNFFEWLLIIVRDARRKVEDAGAWLQATGSKSKKKQHVKSVKSDMNKFLSGERTVQNQTG